MVGILNFNAKPECKSKCVHHWFSTFLQDYVLGIIKLKIKLLLIKMQITCQEARDISCQKNRDLSTSCNIKVINTILCIKL